MENKTQPVNIVTVKTKHILYKGEEPAERIELVELEEVGFKLVAAKGLYQIGDKAIYIQPDYCLSDIPLFESFIRPGGDESKSMLGKVGGLPRRIRAKKFNFSLEPNGDPVYSNGILLPIYEVSKHINYLNGFDGSDINELDINELNLTEELGITKYEEPESNSKGGLNAVGKQRRWIEGIYKTDEENINNLWNHIDKKIGYPITLIGTEKVDGSSITIGIKNGEGFICSRNINKSLTIQKHVGRRNKTFLERLMFWTKPDLNLYEEHPNMDDNFVKYGMPYLEKLKSFHDNIILRGELNGGTLKGSGNKNNPSKSLPPNIKFFGVDYIGESGVATKMENNFFVDLCNTLGFETVKEVFKKEFNSREEIEKTCEEYFKNNMIEGIVLRTPDSKFSSKYMNNLYDSKK